MRPRFQQPNSVTFLSIILKDGLFDFQEELKNQGFLEDQLIPIHFSSIQQLY